MVYSLCTPCLCVKNGEHISQSRRVRREKLKGRERRKTVFPPLRLCGKHIEHFSQRHREHGEKLRTSDSPVLVYSLCSLCHRVRKSNSRGGTTHARKARRGASVFPRGGGSACSSPLLPCRFQKGLPHAVEYEPGEHQARQRQRGGKETAERAPRRRAIARCGFQASRAQKLRLMLGDALAAERPHAMRTAAGGLAVGVIPAALLDGRAHASVNLS